MQNVVTFDASGKIFKASKTVFDKHPDSVLSMLVKRHLESDLKDQPLFLNKDRQVFRWILNFYLTDTLVDHDTVGVPLEIWDAEVDYFGLFQCFETESGPPITSLGEMTSSKRQKRKMDDEFLKNVEDQKRRVNDERDAVVNKRRVEIIQPLLNYLSHNMNAEGYTAWGLIEPDNRHLDFRHNYPNVFSAIKISDIKKYEKEIREAAEEVGFVFRIDEFSEHCTLKKHAYTPAANQYFTHKHTCAVLVLGMIK